jgi:hypothetical protein
LEEAQANYGTLDTLLTNVEMYTGQLETLMALGEDTSEVVKNLEGAISSYLSAAESLGQSLSIKLVTRQSGQRSSVSHDVNGVFERTGGLGDIQLNNLKTADDLNSAVTSARESLNNFRNDIAASLVAVDALAEMPRFLTKSESFTPEDLFYQSFQEALKGLGQ